MSGSGGGSAKLDAKQFFEAVKSGDFTFLEKLRIACDAKSPDVADCLNYEEDGKTIFSHVVSTAMVRLNAIKSNGTSAKLMFKGILVSIQNILKLADRCSLFGSRRRVGEANKILDALVASDDVVIQRAGKQLRGILHLIFSRYDEGTCKSATDWWASRYGPRSTVSAERFVNNLLEYESWKGKNWDPVAVRNAFGYVLDGQVTLVSSTGKGTMETDKCGCVTFCTSDLRKPAATVTYECDSGQSQLILTKEKWNNLAELLGFQKTLISDYGLCFAAWTAGKEPKTNRKSAWSVNSNGINAVRLHYLLRNEKTSELVGIQFLSAKKEGVYSESPVFGAPVTDGKNGGTIETLMAPWNYCISEIVVYFKQDPGTGLEKKPAALHLIARCSPHSENFLLLNDASTFTATGGNDYEFGLRNCTSSLGALPAGIDLNRPDIAPKLRNLANNGNLSVAAETGATLEVKRVSDFWEVLNLDTSKESSVLNFDMITKLMADSKKAGKLEQMSLLQEERQGMSPIFIGIKNFAGETRFPMQTLWERKVEVDPIIGRADVQCILQKFYRQPNKDNVCNARRLRLSFVKDSELWEYDFGACGENFDEESRRECVTRTRTLLRRGQKSNLLYKASSEYKKRPETIKRITFTADERKSEKMMGFILTSEYGHHTNTVVKVFTGSKAWENGVRVGWEINLEPAKEGPDGSIEYTFGYRWISSINNVHDWSETEGTITLYCTENDTKKRAVSMYVQHVGKDQNKKHGIDEAQKVFTTTEHFYVINFDGQTTDQISKYLISSEYLPTVHAATFSQLVSNFGPIEKLVDNICQDFITAEGKLQPHFITCKDRIGCAVDTDRNHTTHIQNRLATINRYIEDEDKTNHNRCSPKIIALSVPDRIYGRYAVEPMRNLFVPWNVCPKANAFSGDILDNFIFQRWVTGTANNVVPVKLKSNGTPEAKGIEFKFENKTIACHRLMSAIESILEMHNASQMGGKTHAPFFSEEWCEFSSAKPQQSPTYSVYAMADIKLDDTLPGLLEYEYRRGEHDVDARLKKRDQCLAKSQLTDTCVLRGSYKAMQAASVAKKVLAATIRARFLAKT